MKKPDFAGWATKYNVKCSDGCTILPSTFQHNDGSVVPLVWQHKGTELDNVLGNVTLKHTDEGVYAYASFNKTHMGQMAKSAVDNGDLKHLSIGAKNIQRKPGNLVHSGDIYEVSLVLTGANSQALIETVLTHSDGSGEEIIITNPDYIHHGDQIQYEYTTSDDFEEEDDETLEHFGIKGMKWGVRRTPEQLGNSGKKNETENQRNTSPEKEFGNQKAFSNGKIQSPRTLEGILESDTSSHWSNKVDMEFHSNRPPMRDYISKNPNATLTVDQMNAINAPDSKKYAEKVYKVANGKDPKPLHEMTSTERKQAVDSINKLYEESGIEKVQERINSAITSNTKPDRNDLNAYEFFEREVNYYSNPSKSDIEFSKNSSNGFADIITKINSGELPPTALDNYFDSLKQSDDLDDILEHADETRTVGDVVESMNEEQRSILEYLLGRAITTTKGEDDMKHNVFTNGTSQEDILQHAEQVQAYKTALQHAYDSGTGRLSDVLGSVLEHAENKGVSNIEVLFPEYKTLTTEPVIYDHNNLASEAIFNGTAKAPFNRIRTWSVDITEQEARARGYIKGNEKFEQIYSVLKRETTPQTVYVKQKFDRDDIIDITDFNLVNWAKKIMGIKLKEELARAILVGDGRLVTDPDKIFPDKIRPIITDNDLYTMKASYTDLHSLFETVLVAMEEYRGSGSPTLIITPTLLTQLKLMRDNENRFLFGLGASNATIAAMFNCSGIIETDFLPTGSMLIVNLSDYTCGATAGGKITDFDQFDIDFNVEKFLRETRMCGALTRLKSALYVTPATPGAVRTNGLVPKGEYAGVVNKEAAPVQNGNKPEVKA